MTDVPQEGVANAASIPHLPDYASIGVRAVEQSAYNQSVADRTGEVLRQAHEVANELRFAKLASVQEPGTGLEALVVVRPNGSVDSLSDEVFNDYRKAPKRKTGIAKLTRIESFVDHVNYHKGGTSVLFANDDLTQPRISAVLDYHGQDAPAFGQHRASFTFPLSKEWQAWRDGNGKKMGLVDFAEFLEDRFVDVEHVEDVNLLNEDIQSLVKKDGASRLASPSRLLELSRGLSIRENAAVKEARNLASGEGQIVFETSHTDDDGKPIDIPTLFIITIPLFARGDYYRIAARLRYRVRGGLQFWYELWKYDDVFEQAYLEACEQAKDNTKLPLFFGSPE